jgi:hypothetical protein
MQTLKQCNFINCNVYLSYADKEEPDKNQKVLQEKPLKKKEILVPTVISFFKKAFFWIQIFSETLTGLI